MRQILKNGDMIKFVRTGQIGIVLNVTLNVYEDSYPDTISEVATIIDEKGNVSTKAVHHIGLNDCKLISFGLQGIEII